MGLPSAREARPFYQSAKQRFDDAQFLYDGGRNTAAVYLAGYVVECALKALILAGVPKQKRLKTIKSFHGSKAHDFVWLKKEYFRSGGAGFPPEISESFSRVNTWSTNMRYNPGTLKRKETEAFLKAVEIILKWADRRF